MIYILISCSPGALYAPFFLIKLFVAGLFLRFIITDERHIHLFPFRPSLHLPTLFSPLEGTRHVLGTACSSVPRMVLATE